MTTAAPSWVGADLDHDALEVLTIAHIDRKLLKAEPALYASKWFDYRPLHPAAATYRFAHLFDQAYKEFWTRAKDFKRGPYVRALKGDGDVMLAREVKSYWRLRQKVDELGMRYEFFLKFAVTWLIEAGWGKGNPHPPRPAQILANSELIVDAMNAWARELRTRMNWANHERYTTQRWVGAPDQVAYERFIVEQIKRRPHPKYALHSALYEFDALRIEAAMEHFDPQAVIDAAAYRLNYVSQE